MLTPSVLAIYLTRMLVQTCIGVVLKSEFKIPVVHSLRNPGEEIGLGQVLILPGVDIREIGFSGLVSWLSVHLY